MNKDASSRSPVGLVGVGLMGTAFAHRLRGAGLSVVGFDVDSARLAQLADIGGQGDGKKKTCNPVIVL